MDDPRHPKGQTKQVVSYVVFFSLAQGFPKYQEASSEGSPNIRDANLSGTFLVAKSYGKNVIRAAVPGSLKTAQVSS